MKKTNLKITPDQTIGRGNDLIASEIDSEIVMMSLEKGKYYSLDSIGTRIWNIIESPTKVSSLIATMLDEYDVTSATCQNDVIQFINELYKEDIVQIVK